MGTNRGETPLPLFKERNMGVAMRAGWLVMGLAVVGACAGPQGTTGASKPAVTRAAAIKPRDGRAALVSLPVAREARTVGVDALAVTAEIDTTAAGRAINAGIYGSTSSMEVAQEIGSPIVRHGGNPLSTVNWKEGFWSSGGDWYFVNNPSTNKPRPPEETLKQLGVYRKAGLDLYLTMPIMGRVAKDGISVAFDTRKYPDQTSWEGKDHPGDVHPYAGSGWQYVRDEKGEIKKDARGKAVVKHIVPDPDDTSIAMSAEDQCDMLRFMVEKMGYGTADKGGLKYLCMDNEPGIWHSTHYGMRPNQGCSYDEYWQRTVDYAGRLKKIDPAVQIAGPASWGWTDFFYSGYDAQLVSEKKGTWDCPPDFAAHGKVPFCKWWMQQLAAYEKAHGVRLVDILDWHFYPAWPAGGEPHDAKGREANVQYTRVFWDPTFKDPSWMGAETGHVIRLVPLMREWIAEANPGMKTCIGEYGVNGWDDASGGVCMAEMLGVWAREGLDMAFMWGGPGKNSSPYFAWKMFRNPDGKHTVFGDRYLPGTVDAPLDVSVHAGRDSGSGRLTFVVINKRGARDAKVTIKLKQAVAEQDVSVYEYSTRDCYSIGQWPVQRMSGGAITVDLPAMTVLRFDLKP